MIPFIDLKPLLKLLRSDLHADLDTILDTSEFIGGPHVEALERVLEAKLGVRNAIACASGSGALDMILSSLTDRDTVAIPNLTFWATYEAAARTGARVILIDVDRDDLQMSFEQFKKAYEKYSFSTAVIVHLFGWASKDLLAIRAYSKERGISLVEDASQAFGVQINGEPLLRGAALAAMSFHPAKVIGGMGDGGAVLTNNVLHADWFKKRRNHARSDHYQHDSIGFNSRMSGMHAAYLLRMLNYSDEILSARRGAMALYKALIDDEDSNLVPKVYMPPEGQTGNGYLNVTTTAIDGSVMEAALVLKDVCARRIYPIPISDQPGVDRNTIQFGGLNVSRTFCRHVINLPLYYGISPDHVMAGAAALHNRRR